MFDYRAGVYLGLIGWILVTILCGGADGFKDVWFRKKNDFQRVGGCLLLFGIMTVIFMIEISEIPLVLNRVYTKEAGVIKDFVLTDITRKHSDVDQYTIVLQDPEDGSTKEFIKVPVAYPIHRGMEVEIHSFTGALFDANALAKIEGQTTDYYKKGYWKRPGERIIVIFIILIHMLLLMGIATREYVIHGKKRRGTQWYIFALLTAVAYGILPLVSLKYPHESLWLGRCMVIAAVFNLIAEAGLAWAANIDDHREEWDAMWKRKNERDKNENATLKETEELKVQIELESQDIASEEKVEAESNPQYQFQQMGYMASERYCSYKFRKRMRSSMGTVVVVELLDVLAAFIIAVLYEDIRRWLAIGIGGFVFLIVFAVGYQAAYRKHRGIKEAISSGEPCEYCVVEAEIYGWLEFICADGHKEIWKMKPDDDAEVKEGELAVAVYLPSIHQVFTEGAKDMNRLLGLNVPVMTKKERKDRIKARLSSEKNRIHVEEQMSKEEHEIKGEEEQKRGEIRMIHHMMDMTKNQAQQYMESKRKKLQRSWIIMIALSAFTPVWAIILCSFVMGKYRIVLFLAICIPGIAGVVLFPRILRRELPRYREAAKGKVQYVHIEDMKFNEPMEFVDEEGNCRKKIFESDKYSEYRGEDSVYVVYVQEMDYWYMEKQLF